VTEIAYDYSSGPIAPAALEAAGVTTVVRYVSTAGNGKNITAKEYADLTGAGIRVLLVYETTARWMLGGYAAGLAAARSARAQAVAVGYPSWWPIWYADDLDDTTADIATVLACLHGCSDAEGSKALTQLYGEYAAVEAAYAAGYLLPWQTVAWSGGERSAHAVLYQTGQTTTCGGVQVDVNEITGSLAFGTTTVAAASTTTEDDEMSTTSQNGRAGLAWAAGTRHVFEVNYAAAGQPDLVLNAELKLTTGPVYLPAITVPHATGTTAVQIPEQYKANCRGVILTVKSGPSNVVYDVCAV
jgi:hypothetical protein